MRASKISTFGDLRGGLNTRDSAYQVTPNQARDLLNVTGSVRGAIRKRDGAVSFATLPNPLNGALAAEATATKQIIGADSVAGKFKAISTGGVASDLTLGVGVTVGTAPWSFVQAPSNSGQGPVFGMNGTQPPVAWDGGTTVSTFTASAGTLPNGKYMAFLANRLWVAGMSSYASVADPGSTLVFSDVNNPRAWSAANWVAFDPNDGDQITGLGTVGPYLLVFKRRKIFVVYDLNTGANRRLSDNTGCAAPRSIVETPVGTFFLADRGVYVTDGQTLKLVSDVIGPTILSLSAANIGLAAGGFHQNHYYLAVSTTGAANDILLDYDVLLESWWRHSLPMSQLLTWRPVSQPGLYGVDSATARVSRLFVPDTPTDYGAAFSAYWTGAWLAPGGSVTRHRLRAIRADLSGHVALKLAGDFTGSPSLVKDFPVDTDTGTFGGSGTFGDGSPFGGLPTLRQVRAPTPAPSVARAFSLQWDSNHTETWQVEGFELMTTERKD